MLLLPQQLDMPPCTTPYECRIQDAIPTEKLMQFCNLRGVIYQYADLLHFHRENTVINDLDSSSYEIIKPIPVVMQEEDGVSVASFIEANINASGETVPDAIDMLKDMIVSSYQLFVEKESVLGEGPKTQLTVLRKHLQPK
jgi:hypothetical protein